MSAGWFFQLNLNAAQSSAEWRRLGSNSSALSVIRSRSDVLNSTSALIYTCHVAGVLDLVTSRDQKAVFEYPGEIQKRSAIEMAENPKLGPQGSVKIIWKFTEEPLLIEVFGDIYLNKQQLPHKELWVFGRHLYS
jgi:hypothetical protein